MPWKPQWTTSSITWIEKFGKHMAGLSALYRVRRVGAIPAGELVVVHDRVDEKDYYHKVYYNHSENFVPA